MTGLIFDIRHYTIHDGPGIRTTVFFKGCPLRCWWCHNPESQEWKVEEVVVERVLEGKRFGKKATVGTWQSVDSVMKEIEKDMVFYQESGGGVTFSGGEPLMQVDFLEKILKECKQRNIHTAIDTCGYAEPAAIKKVIGLVDLWLFDLKLLDDVRHIEYTGLSNELSLTNLNMLVQEKKEIIIRFPVIPEMTDMPGNLAAMVRLMKTLGLKRIDLLPYHAIAREKYRRMGRNYFMEGIKEPNKTRIEELAKYFSEAGLEVGR